MAPSTKHHDVSFRAISTKLEYQQGERVVVAGYVKNESERLRYVLIDPDPAMGAGVELTLHGPDGIYQPDLEPRHLRENPALDNSSFLVLAPASEARVSVFEILEATGPAGEKAPLPPGEYTAKIRFSVRENAGQGVKLQSDAAKYLAEAPRAIWEGNVTFQVSDEMPASPE